MAIRTYDNPVNAPRPDSGGAAAYAQIAASKVRTGNAIAGDIGAVAQAGERVFATRKAEQDKAAAQKEIMEGMNALEALDENSQADYLNTIRTADPNDASVGHNWRTTYLNPKLDEFYSGFQTDAGKAWALQQTQSMKGQYFRTVSADAINRANVATVNNANGAVTSASTNAYNNPDTLDDILGRLDTTIQGLVTSSNTSPEQAASLLTKDWTSAKKEIINGAVLGMAKKNPEFLRDMILDGTFDKKYGSIVGAAGTKSALDLAEGLIKAQGEADRIAKNQAYTDAQRASSEAQAKVIVGQYDAVKGTWSYDINTVHAIMDDKTMSVADKEGTIEKLRQLAGKADATSDTPGLVNDLLKRAGLPTTDPNRLSTTELLSYVGSTGSNRLTQASFRFLQEIMGGDANQKDFMSRTVTAESNAAAARVNPTAGPLGNFLGGAGAKQAEDEMRADVLTRLQRAGSFDNQQRMLTPGDPTYIFTDEYVKAWASKGKDYGIMGSAGSAGTPGVSGGAPGGLGSFLPPAKNTAPVVAPPAVRPPLIFGVPPGQPAPGQRQGSLGTDPVKTASIAQQNTAISTFAQVNNVNADVLKAALRTPDGGMLEPEAPNTTQHAPIPAAGALKVTTDQQTRTVNAAGYGDKLTGSITVNGHNYKFVSGGGGRGSLPLGTYTVLDYMTGPQRAKAGYEYQHDSFMLSNAKDPLLPGQAPRTGLLFHRARGTGTAGCIGIIGDDNVFNQFSNDLNTEVANNGGFGNFKITVGPNG
jgi:hypothetical protein